MALIQLNLFGPIGMDGFLQLHAVVLNRKKVSGPPGVAETFPGGR
jgi:hypothetical protein